jgi:vanillate O-demethylase ferredoxin subunit
MKLRVKAVRLTTPDVLHVIMEHPLRPHLPAWSAGSHVDVRLPGGRIRQYSLCGNPVDRSQYEIAIKREKNSRGGSIEAHEILKPGVIAHVSAPRNNFPLSTDATHHILIAGGIGITPFVSMAHQLSATAKSFELHYCARSPQEAPLLAEVIAIANQRVRCWFSSQGTRFDPAILGQRRDASQIYACGPQALLDAVTSYAQSNGWGEDDLHMEAFQPTRDENFKPEPFEAILASTGRTLSVPADKSLLEVLRDNGIMLVSSCEMGVCGSCECGYRRGTVIHRDKALAVSKRQDRLLPCVSRARVSVTLEL